MNLYVIVSIAMTCWFAGFLSALLLLIFGPSAQDAVLGFLLFLRRRVRPWKPAKGGAQ